MVHLASETPGRFRLTPPFPKRSIACSLRQPHRGRLQRGPVVGLHDLLPDVPQHLPGLVRVVRDLAPRLRLPLEAAEAAARRLVAHEGEEDAGPEAADQREEAPEDEGEDSGRAHRVVPRLLEGRQGEVLVVGPVHLLRLDEVRLPAGPHRDASGGGRAGRLRHEGEAARSHRQQQAERQETHGHPGPSRARAEPQSHGATPPIPCFNPAQT
mmetsp:Transcript_30253/g.89844  ORF Transcript_30253/g.89844 Transcript_30253/m.89844 type:complete len:212 (+) Transcript_30253:61-696(+)